MLPLLLLSAPLLPRLLSPHPLLPSRLPTFFPLTTRFTYPPSPLPALQGYATFEPASKKKKQGEGGDDDEEDDEAVDVSPEAGSKAAAAAAARGYDYLLGMPLWSLTMEKVEQLKAELAAKEAELQKVSRRYPGPSSHPPLTLRSPSSHLLHWTALLSFPRLTRTLLPSHAHLVSPAPSTAPPLRHSTAAPRDDDQAAVDG